MAATALRRCANIYFSFVYVFCVSTAEWWAASRGFPLDPAWLLALLLSPLLLLVAGACAADSRLTIRMLALTRHHALVLVPFSLLALLSVALALLPEANLRDGIKHVAAPSYDLFIFYVTLVVAGTLDSSRLMKRSTIVALLLLCASLLISLADLEDLHFTGGRPSGLSRNSARTGLMLALLTAASLAWRGPLARDAVLLVLAGAGIFVTLTRSAFTLWIFLFAARGALALWRVRFSGRQLAQTAGWLALVPMLLAGLLALLVSRTHMLSSQNALGRTYAMTGRANLVRSEAGEKRYEVVYEFLDDFGESPLLGRGTGFNRSKPTGSHNEFLRHLGDNGILGGALYLAVLLGGLTLFLVRRHWPGTFFILVALAESFVSHNLFDGRTFLMVYAVLCAETTPGDR